MMKKERFVKYKNSDCIVILKNSFKYEGVISEVFEDSFIIKDRKGDIEISNDAVVLIINSKEGER